MYTVGSDLSVGPLILFCPRQKAFAGDYNLPTNGVDVVVMVIVNVQNIMINFVNSKDIWLKFGMEVLNGSSI